jgi:protein-disulfide isomerase
MRKLFLLFIFFLLVSDLSAADKRYNIPIDDSPFLGSKNAPVTIIEFLDYQ